MGGSGVQDSPLDNYFHATAGIENKEVELKYINSDKMNNFHRFVGVESHIQRRQRRHVHPTNNESAAVNLFPSSAWPM